MRVSMEDGENSEEEEALEEREDEEERAAYQEEQEQEEQALSVRKSYVAAVRPVVLCPCLCTSE